MEGVVSTQRALVVLSTETSVAAIKPAGVTVVPRDSSPPVPLDKDALAELEGESEPDGERDAEGESEALGDCDKLALADGEREPEALEDAELEGLVDAEGEIDELGDKEPLALGLKLAEGELDSLLEGEIEADGLKLPEGEDDTDALGDKLPEGERLADGEELGESEELGEVEAEGESEADTAVKGVITLPKILKITAPVTVNRELSPRAPVPVLASKVILLRAWIDQPASVTLAPPLFCCAIFISLYFRGLLLF